MKLNWGPLTAELARWRAEALDLPLWWRDDDAVAATAALERLGRLATETGMPLHLAVIPDLAEPSLSTALEEHSALIPVVHGWRHVSHAPAGEKNAEFGHFRAVAPQELRRASARLEAQFGPRLLPLFVPPWNRMDPCFFPVLSDAGYLGVSTFGARKMACAAQAVVQINTHIDPIYWRGHRGLVDPDTLLSGIVLTLRNRREGYADRTEPLGLLTHHLIQNDEVWAFIGDAIRVLLDGGARPADLAKLLYAGRNPSI